MNENNPLCSRFGVSHTCPICKSEKLIKLALENNVFVVRNLANDLSLTTVIMLIQQILTSKLFSLLKKVWQPAPFQPKFDVLKLLNPEKFP